MSVIDVFIDTTALPMEPNKFDNLFLKRLCTLSKNKILSLYISEVIVLEWKSHLRGKMEDDIKKAIDATKQLKKNSWLDELRDSPALNETKDYLTKAVPEIHNIVEKKVGAILNDRGVVILPVKEHHGINVIGDYFCGNPPFKKAKSREDFLDSFIYQCVKDFIRKNHEIHCITDKNLGCALATLEGVTSVHSSTYDFLKAIKDITAKLDEELKWRRTYNIMVPELPKLYDDIKNRLEEKLIDEVTYKYVEHREIPSDNHEAIIEGIYDVMNFLTVEWDKIDSIGAGIILIPFNLVCDADLEFPIFYMNVYDVPDGVLVSYGDHEEDAFFEASGSVTLQIDGMLSLEFDIEKISDGLPELKDIQIERVKICLIENNEDGSIF